MRVGAADTSAEREADEVAARVVRNIAAPSAPPAPTVADTRIRRSAARLDRPVDDVARVRPGTVQRAPYLFNADDMIYRESDAAFGDADFAHLGVLKGAYPHVFVPYSSLDSVGDVIASELDRLANQPRAANRPTTRRTAKQATPWSYPAPAVAAAKTAMAPRAGAKQSAKALHQAALAAPRGIEKRRTLRPGRVEMSDRRRDVASNVKQSLASDSELAAFGAALRRALPTIYEVDPTTNCLRPIPGASDELLATAVMWIVESGASLRVEGGGSRLPRAKGTITISHDIPEARSFVFAALGVDPTDQRYMDIEVQSRPGAVAYGDAREDASEATGVFDLRLPQGVDAYYSSTVSTTRSSNSMISVAGERFSDDEFFGISDAGRIQQLRGELGRLPTATADSGWIPGTDLTAPKDRGDGQAAAMGNWNALGAAACANLAAGAGFDVGQNWEWLHVRGAQLGGSTDGSNLVAGLYVTNSFMIPFEKMVRNWAAAGPSSFHASFRAINAGAGFAERLEIWIRAEGHPELHDLPEQRLIEFDPLRGVVVDQLAAEFVKRRLDRTVGVRK